MPERYDIDDLKREVAEFAEAEQMAVRGKFPEFAKVAVRPADPQHWSKRMRWMLERIEELEAENQKLRDDPRLGSYLPYV